MDGDLARSRQSSPFELAKMAAFSALLAARYYELGSCRSFHSFFTFLFFVEAKKRFSRNFLLFIARDVVVHWGSSPHFHFAPFPSLIFAARCVVFASTLAACW